MLQFKELNIKKTWSKYHAIHKIQIISFMLICGIFIMILPKNGHAQKSEQIIYTAPLDKDYSTLLYKMQIKFKEHNFSGLIVFKNNSDKSEYNIVCLSEVGLNIMEYKYSIGKIDLIKHTALFENKKVFKLMKKYFILLFQDVEKNKIKVKQSADYVTIKTKLKKKSGVKTCCFYLYDKNKKNKKIYTRGLLPLKYEIKSNINNIPEEIIFSQHLLKLSITLELLRVKN